MRNKHRPAKLRPRRKHNLKKQPNQQLHTTRKAQQPRKRLNGHVQRRILIDIARQGNAMQERVGAVVVATHALGQATEWGDALSSIPSGAEALLPEARQIDGKVKELFHLGVMPGLVEPLANAIRYVVVNLDLLAGLAQKSSSLQQDWGGQKRPVGTAQERAATQVTQCASAVQRQLDELIRCALEALARHGKEPKPSRKPQHPTKGLRGPGQHHNLVNIALKGHVMRGRVRLLGDSAEDLSLLPLWSRTKVEKIARNAGVLLSEARQITERMGVFRDLGVKPEHVEPFASLDRQLISDLEFLANIAGEDVAKAPVHREGPDNDDDEPLTAVREHAVGLILEHAEPVQPALDRLVKLALDNL